MNNLEAFLGILGVAQGGMYIMKTLGYHHIKRISLGKEIEEPRTVILRDLKRVTILPSPLDILYAWFSYRKHNFQVNSSSNALAFSNYTPNNLPLSIKSRKENIDIVNSPIELHNDF